MEILIMDAVVSNNSNNDGRDASYYTNERIRYVDQFASDDDRLWATFLHLGGMCGYILWPLCIIVPLIIWLAKRGDSAFIDDHGKEVLNFQISINLWAVAAGLLVFCGIGIVLAPALIIFGLVVMILNAIRANRGEYVRYPMTIRFFA